MTRTRVCLPTTRTPETQVARRNPEHSLLSLHRGRCLRQRLSRTLGGFRFTTVDQHLDHSSQLSNRQTDAHAGGHVRAQLWLHTGRRSQRTDGGELAALPIEIVTLEDVAKQVRLQ